MSALSRHNMPFNLYRECDRSVKLTAASGVAACSIGGQTIHSFAGISDGRVGLDRTCIESILSGQVEKLEDIR